MKGKNIKIFVILLFFLFSSFQLLFSQTITEVWIENDPKLELGLPLGHSDKIKSIAYSPDGRFIASGSHDDTIKIWDVETGKCLKTLQGHSDGVSSVAYSPNGRFIASGSHDDTIKLWEVETGRCLKTLKGHSDGVSSVTYSPEGRFLASGSWDYTIKIWDVETRKCLKTIQGHSSWVNSVTYSPDGRYLASGSDDDTIKIWDIETGWCLRTLKGHSDEVFSVAYSPDGKFIASGSSDHTVKHWDIETGTCLKTLQGHNNCFIFSVAYSPNSRFIASGDSYTTIKIWNVETGKCLKTLEGQNAPVSSVTYSPDGRFIASGSWNKTIKTWDVETGKCLKTLQGHNKSVNSVTYSPDGRFLASGSWDYTIKIWDVETGKGLKTLQGHKHNVYVDSVAYSPDGRFLTSKGLAGIFASGSDDDTIKIWNIETGNCLKTLKGHNKSVNSVAYSPNGKFIVSGSSDKTIKIWDAETGKCLKTLKGHDKSVNSVAYSPDGKLLASGSHDDTIKIWEVETGSCLKTLEGHSSGISGIYSVAYSPNGKFIASGSWDRTIKIWDVETGSCLRIIEGHNDWAPSIVYSPDGRFLASGSYDKTIKIWDVTTGSCLKTLTGHSRAVTSVAYSPDERFIVSGSYDTSVKIWDPSSGKCLATLHTFGEDDWSVTTPEGLFDASDGAMKKMYFVQGLEMIELEQLKDRYYEPGLLAKIIGYHDEEISINPEELPERVKLYPEIEALVMMDTLEVELRPREGGIGNVRVAINGKEIADNVLVNRGITENGGGEAGRPVYLSIPLKNHPYLVPGEENEISVYAYEEENWLKSRPVTCTYRTEPVDTERIPAVYIIAAGISDYTGRDIDLRFAAKDAEDIAYALSLGAKKLFGTDKTKVHLLTAGREESKYGFQNREPTKENIRGAIEEVAEKAKSTDIVIIYLSGHGISYGSDPGDFYYLTKEAKSSRASTYSDPVIRRNASISSTELMELVKQVPANRQVLIIDTCASGRVVDNLLADRDISSSTVRALDRMKDRTGMFILTGSAADAVSYEASSFGQGVLTYSILEGIKGAALRDNSYIDVMTLFTRAQERVPQLAEHLGGIQRPEVFAQNRLGSFDIGMVTPEEQEKVPLAQPRPVFIQSNFQDEYVPRDIINLEKHVDEELKRRSEQGRNSDCVFVPVREYPHAYSVGGRYERTDEDITLKAGLFEGDNPVETFTITAKDATTLAYQLVERALHIAND